ncbi:hypothetical protein HY772_05405 [Candidatus Woesearchaeota archaeon]|nr:hypothetical protein [Candidatus Woesearchaeota archaeon]
MNRTKLVKLPERLDMMKTPLWSIFLVAGCTILTSFGQLFFKLGMNRFVPSFVGVLTNFQLFGGLAFYGFGALGLIVAFKYGEMSVLYPIVSLSFIWVAGLSFFFLDEHVKTFEVVGLFMILFGVSMIGKGSRGKKIVLRG